MNERQTVKGFLAIEITLEIYLQDPLHSKNSVEIFPVFYASFQFCHVYAKFSRVMHDTLTC